MTDNPRLSTGRRWAQLALTAAVHSLWCHRVPWSAWH